ncbi:MAG: hypothetical protein LAT56_16395 [Wenzhouxiangella sp.]|nr:hypothetical protein [Wenzhouxiangella sp.]
MLAFTLILYLVVLVGIGIWAKGRVGDSEDFHLAGRRMGPVVAALSASASSSSAWTLLGMSGAAYAWGLQAIWLIPAVVSGFFINWVFIAPRLQPASHRNQALTLVEFLGKGADPGSEGILRVWGALIILFCFTLYVASQFQAAGTAISTALPITSTLAMVIGAVIVIVYVFLGGFWAASVTDALQGLMLRAVALVRPTAALIAVGGPVSLWQGLVALDDPSLLRLVDQPGLLLAMVFVAGLFGIGLGYPGQPHVVNRFMALKSVKQVRFARNVALGWAVLIYIGMVVLGWSGRVLLPALTDAESVLLQLSVDLLPAVLGGLITGGVLAAIMSTSDSQLLFVGPVAGRYRLAAMLCGALLTILISFVPQAPGNAIERLVPFFLSLAIAWRGAKVVLKTA